MELAVHSPAFSAPDYAVQRIAGEYARQHDLSVHLLPTEKEFNADFLLTYLIHPGTAIYLGYNSDLQNLDHELMQDPAAWRTLHSQGSYER